MVSKDEVKDVVSEAVAPVLKRMDLLEEENEYLKNRVTTMECREATRTPKDSVNQKQKKKTQSSDTEEFLKAQRSIRMFPCEPNERAVRNFM